MSGRVKVRATGGVVMRYADNGKVEIVVCERSAQGLFALPKGRPEAGETQLETALREVREETGLTTTIVDDIGEVNYTFKQYDEAQERMVLYDKRVHFYLMCPTGGSFEDSDDEYDHITWMEYELACQRLRYPLEVRIVRKANEIFRASTSV